MSRLRSLIFLLLFAIASGVWGLYTLVPDFSLHSYLSEDRKVLCVAGDVMLARNVEVLMNRMGGEYPYQYQTFCPADADFLVNFEASVPAVHKPTPSGGFTFSVRERYVDPLVQAGVTHVSLANNHADDFGASGRQQTVETLTESGLETMNPYAWKLVDIGVDAAIIAVDVTVAPFDQTAFDNVVTAASVVSEMQIVYVHWGEEYVLAHNAEQEQLVAHLAARGVDVVIGHHPHVVQDIDIVDGTLVFYSLGNYIFDQYFSDDVQEGLALRMSYQSGWEIDLVPVETQSFKSAPRSMDVIAGSVFLKELAERSHPALHEQITTGQIRL